MGLVTFWTAIDEVNLDNGDRGWRWKVGADIEAPGLLLPDRVFFASFDAVLYGLQRGGNLAWRSALPSRPLSGPLLLDDRIVIACHENEILGFELTEGRSLGSLHTAAEIRTAPLIAGRLRRPPEPLRRGLHGAQPGRADQAPAGPTPKGTQKERRRRARGRGAVRRSTTVW